MPEDRVDILGLTSREFVDASATHEPDDAATLRIYRAFYRQACSPPPWAAAGVASTVDRLCGSSGGTEAEAGTVKFLQQLHDGHRIESVIIPSVGSRGTPRATLCVSSQVGCARGCTFCQTAQMGLLRNLTTAEIVGQWFAARFGAGRIIRNVVFMGMGEPLDNLDTVIQALRILADDNGPGIAPSRLTVSTVGRVDGILRLAELAREPGFSRLGLAVSVNAPNDEVRDQIMPINRRTPMARLMTAMQAWPANGRRRVLIEYVLIPGVNDELKHADELCVYLEPLRCVVNVIPYNPRDGSPWPAPDEASVERFVTRIHDHGQSVRRRGTKGRSIMAACGQLG